jgi:hypothetical protein
MSCRIWSYLFATVAHLAIGLSAAVAAPITYVDATDGAAGNTALAAGGVWTAAVDPAANGTDNLWRKRAFGNGASIFEASGQGTPTDDAQRLATTISGLVAGQSYKLYAYFWSPNDINQQWLLRAGLTNPGGDLPSWTRLNNDAVNNPGGVVGTDADSILIIPDGYAQFPASGPADFANPGSLLASTTTQAGKTVITESSRFLWQASLGTAVAGATGTAVVYIDDYVLSGGGPPAGTQTVNNRSWYDGVGYELVPEPTAIALFLLAQPFALLRVRKRTC